MVLEFIGNNIEFFVFIFALTIFLVIKRKNLEAQGYFPIFYMLLYKTRLGLDRMDRWSKKHPRVFLYLSYLSIFIGIFGMIATFFFMAWQLNFIVDKEITSGGGLVLPLKTDAGLDGAVPIFFVPFWYWIIALFILVIVHEFAHGVIAERFRIKIKSSGFAFGAILLPILPAAFVEPDIKSLQEKPWWQQIAVFGAGSTSNFIFGALFLILWIGSAGLIDKTMQAGDITFSSVLNESDLKSYGIDSGSIVALNSLYNSEDIINKLVNLSVNETINLTILDSKNNITQNFTVNTFENPNFEDRGMVGISGLNFNIEPKSEYVYLGSSPLHLERMLFYIWFLNIGIGIMNLLPIGITDGGQILRTLLFRFSKNQNNAIKIYTLVTLLSILMIIFTIWPKLLFNLISLF